MKSARVLKILHISRQTLVKYVQNKDIRVVELPNGFYDYNDDGNYVTPPESGGTHTWAVTYLQIWDAEGELVEELNDTTYMNGEYNW